MRLVRVQVPNFKALKNVDISFEPEFKPSIFPLGSLNGGGKSTLLQLIFVLLHCARDPDKSHFIHNMLDGFEIPEGENQAEIATFEFLIEEKRVRSKFIFVNGSFLQKDLNINAHFNLITALVNARVDLQKNQVFDTTTGYLEGLQEKVNFLTNSLEKIGFSIASLISVEQTTCGVLNSLSYISDDEKEKPLSSKELAPIINLISKNIFLAAPSTQIYHFLDGESKQRIFQQEIEKTYQSSLFDAKQVLTNFSIYEFLSIESFIELFSTARDQDFATLVETGSYGNFYTQLLDEVSWVLNKKVYPKIDKNKNIIGIIFKIEVDGKEIELSPSDLSHGELRKLSLYAWIKAKKIKNAVVLIDEIEGSLHPDWQYHIARSLKEWESSNQYILATHSYEVCEAVTPAHVKEIEPRLSKPVIEDKS